MRPTPPPRFRPVASSVWSAADRWFLAPEPAAAGRMGLYRILFCAFCLWYRAWQPAAAAADFVPEVDARMALLGALRRAVPYPRGAVMEFAIIASLVALLIGWRTRAATAAVLVVGVAVEAQYAAVKPELAVLPMALYIPAFMLLAGDWGACHSLDALRRQAAGRPTLDPRDSDGGWFVPARAVLLVVAGLFVWSGAAKLAVGSWWAERDLLGYIALKTNVKAALHGMPLDPFAPAFARHRFLHESARFLIVAFEVGFAVALLGGLWRRLAVGAALAFHAFNALVLLVTFTPMLIVYPLFMDLQAAADWGWRRLPGGARAGLRSARDRASGRPPWQCDAAGAAISLAFAALWTAGPWLPWAFRLGGWLDWRTIWIPVLPAAAAWVASGFYYAIKRRRGGAEVDILAA